MLLRLQALDTLSQVVEDSVKGAYRHTSAILKLRQISILCKLLTHHADPPDRDRDIYSSEEIKYGSSVQGAHRTGDKTPVNHVPLDLV